MNTPASQGKALITGASLFLSKKNPVTAAIAPTIAAALVLCLSAPAWAAAGEATLADNERAAQAALVEVRADSRIHGLRFGGVNEATLTRNEDAARCVIAASPNCENSEGAAPRSMVAAATDEVTLAHDERAAQRAIVEPAVYSRQQRAQSPANGALAR